MSLIIREIQIKTIKIGIYMNFTGDKVENGPEFFEKTLNISGTKENDYLDVMALFSYIFLSL